MDQVDDDGRTEEWHHQESLIRYAYWNGVAAGLVAAVAFFFIAAITWSLLTNGQ